MLSQEAQNPTVDYRSAPESLLNVDKQSYGDEWD